ncbi:hypothetical protein [Nesterenkonia sp. K-15-9-6]|uniref:hypothetical protein n=1 Tax=Nesterenkonia sp. K-15-9-6 TaxID=3093918 RepID=UPI004043FFEA
MAIPTTYDITFQCGHTEAKDLSDTPAGKRKGRAFGLGKNFVCGRCFRKRGKEDLQKQNQQTLLDAEAFDAEHSLPALEGTEKQVDWATRARYEAVASILDDDPAGDDGTAILAAARTLTRAGWWIDNTTDSDLDTDDLIELITTAQDDTEYLETENPY